MIWRRKYDKVQINRKQYRIAFNWNCYCNFLEKEGMTIDCIDQVDKLSTLQFLGFIYEAIVEGCRMENKIFPYTKEDLGAMLSPEAITGLSYIFQAQITKPHKG